MCFIEQHQDCNLTSQEVHNRYYWRKPRRICTREKILISHFEELQKVIGGNAQLEIFSGNCSSFSSLNAIGINLWLNNQYRDKVPKIKIIDIDLFVLAHEFGHQAQIIHQGNRCNTASRRSKEANADYFAGLWIGIKLGINHDIDFKGLSQIAFNLKGGGDGQDKYPYPEQREQLLLGGCANAATLQLMLNTDIATLKQALNIDGIEDIWNSSDMRLSDWQADSQV